MLDDVKALIAELHPPVLDHEGLDAAIRDRLETLAERGTGARVTATLAIPALPATVETAAYRIVSEAVTNVARHAQASLVDVDVHEDEGMLMITVADDGVGLLPQARASGVGLGSMRERASELGGRCTIAPGPEGGTVVSARLPIGGPVGARP